MIAFHPWMSWSWFTTPVSIQHTSEWAKRKIFSLAANNRKDFRNCKVGQSATERAHLATVLAVKLEMISSTEKQFSGRTSWRFTWLCLRYNICNWLWYLFDTLSCRANTNLNLILMIVNKWEAFHNFLKGHEGQSTIISLRLNRISISSPSTDYFAIVVRMPRATALCLKLSPNISKLAFGSLSKKRANAFTLFSTHELCCDNRKGKHYARVAD